MKIINRTFAILVAALCWGAISADGQQLPSGNLNSELWPAGVVKYRFAEVGDLDPLGPERIDAAHVLDADYRTRVRDQMARCRFPVNDPTDNSSKTYIRFDAGCSNRQSPRPDAMIQPGGLWLRIFQ